jgi:two-component system, OmpR family, response regulator
MANDVGPSSTAPSPEESAPLRVLLVEDHPDLAAATVDFLESEGLDVRAALTGRAALDLVSSFQPQLVLCDLRLPDMNGLEVVRDLRANPATQRICVAILSAFGGIPPTWQSEATELGVDAMIVKPITVETIRRLVETARKRIPPDGGSPRR